MLSLADLGGELSVEGQEDHLLVVDADCYQLEVPVVVLYRDLEEGVGWQGDEHRRIWSRLAEVDLLWHDLHACVFVVLVAHAQDADVELLQSRGCFG